ncbi:hypothetical protein M378DRAFT_603372 [Amanita muscaria Koide BX008]|uniref:CCHC-type domain-containing protein n=1 Tax=Amanita muscaria (strain Koide BX008) TaxID=946122 RepID=A0A0C2XKR8_AMAMK|nr:hypothetical protein M378DRAFT_603372 [Amanita muscaria Koide BX008]
MSLQFSRKGCFKCVGHIAEACPSTERLCYNCRQPGHESSACPSPRSVSAKQCYSCGGVGHIQAECPSIRIQNSQKCYNCGRPGHFARACSNGSGGGFASRAPPPGRGLNMSTLPPVKCYRCGGPNHMARSVCFPLQEYSASTLVQGIALLRLVTSLVIPRIRARPATNVNRRVMYVLSSLRRMPFLRCLLPDLQRLS